MKMWVVEAGFHYEPHSNIALCSTEEKAEKLRDKWERLGSYDWVHATSYTVDAHEPDHSHIT